MTLGITVKGLLLPIYCQRAIVASCENRKLLMSFFLKYFEGWSRFYCTDMCRRLVYIYLHSRCCNGLSLLSSARSRSLLPEKRGNPRLLVKVQGRQFLSESCSMYSHLHGWELWLTKMETYIVIARGALIGILLWASKCFTIVTDGNT